MIRSAYALLLLLLIFSCADQYSARQLWSPREYDKYLVELAPYVNKKQDNVAFKDRFSKEQVSYYRELIKAGKSVIPHAFSNDTATYFVYVNKDLSSLFEHYRAQGGYFKLDKDGRISYLNLLFHTPRLTKEEMDIRAKELFKEMAEKGNIDKYLHNPLYVKTPTADFYYNDIENKWDFTTNSSWNFLKDVKKGSEDIQ